jgi:hypothetical protein
MASSFGTSTTMRRRAEMEDRFVPPLRLTSSCSCSAETPVASLSRVAVPPVGGPPGFVDVVVVVGAVVVVVVASVVVVGAEVLVVG